MEGILDFSQDVNVPLLDNVAKAMLSSSGAEQQQAQRVLTQFQEHPDSWQRVPTILSQSSNTQTKFIALQIMDRLITTRWKVLPESERSGVRNFIVEVIISTTSDESNLRREKSYINKLNMILVQILKQEWPHNWPNFIPEIISASKNNLALCENNMVILKLLSEEIFDFSSDSMTTTKTKNLKNTMCGQFGEVYELCHLVLQSATKSSLIKATLETLLRFLNWIPLGYIFETDLIDMLIVRFLETPEFRNVTLRCLGEIGALSIGPEYNPKFIALFNMVMTSVNKMVPPHTDIRGVYNDSSDDDQQLILNLALFLSNYLSAHLKLLENDQNKDVLLNAHLYLIKISQVEEREVFKICLEYWSTLVSSLYEEQQSLPLAENPLLSLNLSGASMGPTHFAGAATLRKNIYSEVLSNLRLVMIERMVKPEEVLVVENDEGEIVREFMKEIDTIVLYKQMREVLVYLTHLDVQDTEIIMTEKLAKQVDGSEWSWANCNTLCWAIGSISGAMNEETEKRFLVTVIKELLSLTEMKRGKDNKAVVASNIMYIVGQYPRFLKAHWKFLKTVVNKLFEFMHETHEGVQDMACDTFIKIAQKCRRHFVLQQAGESEPFIDEILRNLHHITNDLTPLQTHVFFEATGYMIAAQPNKAVQERLIAKLMEMPNSAWDNLMQQAASSMDVLGNPDNIKILSNVLKTNVAACTSIGPFFTPQIGRNYVDMLGLYRAVSGIINESIAAQGDIATKTPKVRSLRTIKKEVLKLVETYIKKAEEVEQVNANLIPALLDAVLGDYLQNIPQARDAEVLNVMATIVSRLGSLLTDKVPAILAAVFECTLTMITQDFSEYPEHRVGFYRLLQQITNLCFPALLTLEPPQFKLVIDSLMWGTKHTARDISDISLGTCLTLISNISNAEPQVAAAFFSSYYLNILQDTFFVLTDSEHKSSFKGQTALLAKLFYLVESNSIQAPLWDPSTVTDPGMTNNTFIRQYCTDLLRTAFPHMRLADIQTFVSGLCELNQDPVRFKLNLRDFLVSLREFSDDSGELFLEDKEAEMSKQKEAERVKAQAVPGMIKPAEQEDEEL